MRLTRLLGGLGAAMGVIAAVTVASASPASAQPMITVTPDTDLVDFQTVTVSGLGFTTDTELGMVMCTAGASSTDDCDLDTLDFVVSDATGGFTTDFTVERLIETPATGPVDCAPGACVLGVGTADLSQAAVAPLAFDPAVPPQPRLEIGVTIDPVGTVTPKTGTGTVTGTVTCSSPAEVFIDGFASQRAGRFEVQGFFFTDAIACDGSATWTGDLESFNGRFVGGKLDVDVFAFGFDEEQFDDAQVITQIRLKGGR